MIDQHAGAARPGMLSLDELRQLTAADKIDTVILALTDMQGRLQGKRLSAEFFLDDVVHHFAEGCNYLLAVDVDMNTVDGYAMSSWERGYGNPAPETLIVVGFPRDFLGKRFASCELAGRKWNRYGVANEETVEDPDIFVCRGLRGSWEAFWKEVRGFA